MTLMVKDIHVKRMRSPSRIYPWGSNPYTGCRHGCPYCYARFMNRVTGHRELRGGFVGFKIRVPDCWGWKYKRRNGSKWGSAT